MAGGNLLGAPWDEYYEALPQDERSRMKIYREDGWAGSDNGPFMESGAPTLSFWSSGEHPFYHNYTDDASGIVDSVLENVGERAEDIIRFLGNYDRSLACHTDSLRITARVASTIDFDGFFVDPSGTLPKLSAVTAAWLPHDALLPVEELVRRMAELHFICTERDVESEGLAEAIEALKRDRDGVFLGIPEAALAGRPPQHAQTLIRQGLSLVRLSPGNTPASGSMSTEIEEILRGGGVFAKIPLDFATPSRVSVWGRQGIVRASLGEFAALPVDILDALLANDALISLTVEPAFDEHQIDAIRHARQRFVHLDFGPSYSNLRESEIRSAARKLYEFGMDRGDILLLTGGNLRRFLQRESG